MSLSLILCLGAMVLACGCVGLLLVRINNPRLLGLGWLGAAFAAGGAGAALLLGSEHLPSLVGVLLADVLVLLSFVLLHAAVLELTEAGVVPWLGLCLLVAQAIADLARHYGGLHGLYRDILASLLIGVQAMQTAVVLWRTAKKGIRAPAAFSVSLLLIFACFNLWRAGALALGYLDEPAMFHRVEAATYLLYLGFALGIAFAFFWATTASLTASLEELASTDPLTRLFNRRVFLRWCQREIARGRDTGAPFTILMIDLDHFKLVNDRFGHAAGDSVLCAAVEKMQDAVRGIDVLGRWGGEEFAALLPGASAEAALIVADRVRKKIEGGAISLTKSKEWNGGAELVRVTASVGVATYTGPEDSVEAMLARADRALYQAKARGRNQVLEASTMEGHPLAISC